MTWIQTVTGDEMLCFEDKAKAVSCRIESRKIDGRWIIYKSYFDGTGLNYTEEYVAPTREKMHQIITALQKQKRPTLQQIRQLVLARNKRIDVQIEREFKEYGVEKWTFGINGGAHSNFALVRSFDEIDIDFVMHDAYRAYEDMIIKEIVDMLGFDGMEDAMHVNVYYFNANLSKEMKKGKSDEEPADLF